MFSREIFFSPRSRRDLKGTSGADQEAILADIESLAKESHLPSPPKVKKLKGISNLHRLRTGEYRTIFRIGAEGLYILRIVPRKELERVLSGLWG